MKQYSDGVVRNVRQARRISRSFLKGKLNNEYEKIKFGLPERDDRYSIWVVPLIADFQWLIRPDYLGQIHIDWNTGEVTQFTEFSLILQRLRKAEDRKEIHKDSIGKNKKQECASLSLLDGSIFLGVSQKILSKLSSGSIHFVITSPPYYNARPSYSEYVDYEQYLDELGEVFQACHRVLSEGRFLVINSSPVLQRRISRKYSSKRIPVPFDIHEVVSNLGFEFIDDIIWKKPEGAGWNTGRGRRFRADRQPLQYKPVPVTEYFMVYRKATRKLIDWNIRNYESDIIEESKIEDGYHVTNVWEATPASHPKHPAVFPVQLIEDFVKYYSFKNDIVLDPFAGTGTVGHAAIKTGRRFVLIDSEEDYFRVMVDELTPKCIATGMSLQTDDGEEVIMQNSIWK
jgi:DNA modification methylase